MPNLPADLSNYRCSEYLASRWASEGLWDESAQLWLLEPLSRAQELLDCGFLQVGRPGTDGIGFGYRAGHDGFWAYYPIEQHFQLLAPSLDAFIVGWAACTIKV